jgi:hypothetical protein
MTKDIDVGRLAEEQRLKTIFDETVKEELSGGAKSPGLLDYMFDSSGSEIRAKAISTAKDIERRRPPTESGWENSSGDDGGSWSSESTTAPEESQGDYILTILVILFGSVVVAMAAFWAIYCLVVYGACRVVQRNYVNTTAKELWGMARVDFKKRYKQDSSMIFGVIVAITAIVPVVIVSLLVAALVPDGEAVWILQYFSIWGVISYSDDETTRIVVKNMFASLLSWPGPFFLGTSMVSMGTLSILLIRRSTRELLEKYLVERQKEAEERRVARAKEEKKVEERREDERVAKEKKEVALAIVNAQETSQSLKDGYLVGLALHQCISYQGNLVGASKWLEMFEVVKKYPPLMECCSFTYINTDSVSAENFYFHMYTCISGEVSDDHKDFAKGLRYGRTYGR